MSIYADMYPDKWTPSCPHEEQAAEEWQEYQERRELKA